MTSLSGEEQDVEKSSEIHEMRGNGNGEKGKRERLRERKRERKRETHTHTHTHTHAKFVLTEPHVFTVFMFRINNIWNVSSKNLFREMLYRK